MKALLVLPFLTGCALLGTNPALSPEQLRAIAADNKNSSLCITAPVMGGVTKAVVVQIDETRNIDSVTTVEGNCDKMTVTTTTQQPGPRVVVPKTP